MWKWEGVRQGPMLSAATGAEGVREIETDAADEARAADPGRRGAGRRPREIGRGRTSSCRSEGTSSDSASPLPMPKGSSMMWPRVRVRVRVRVSR